MKDTSKIIRVGLVGAGGIGGAHSSAYEQLEDVKVCAVVDVREEQAKRLAMKHGARAYASLDEMLHSEEVDMVDVCVPSFLHKETVISCARRGWHVLCEKPIAYTLEDAQEMVQAARDNQVQFMIAQVIRFWPEYMVLKQVYDEQRYGKLLQAWFSRVCGAPIWSWENWYVDPLRSRMAPFEMHIHDVDFLHYLLGLPDAVRSVSVENLAVYASFIKTQYFYDQLPGVVIEAEGAWWQGEVPFAHTFRVVFEGATLIFDSQKLTIYAGGDSKPQVVELGGQVQMAGAINLQSTGGIYNEIAYFVDCLRTGEPPTVITPEQSLNSLKILLAEIESARQGVEVRMKAER
jgi:predicted dehydrogenase